MSSGITAKMGRPKGCKQSPETIEKIRRAQVEHWKDPDYRAHHLPLLKAYAARRRCLPARGTREYKQYEKVRSILGVEAARAMQTGGAT